MNEETQARFEARARIVKAMAHPTRLFLVDVLSRGKQCVRDLTDMVGADMSTVSKHLSVLKNVGILQDERQGLQIFYSLRCPCILRFFDCVESVIKTTAEDQLKLVD
jgi:ArsR family transcriptional regulator